MNENENKVEELKDVVTDIQEVAQNTKLTTDAGGKSKAGLILIGILSVLGIVKIFGIIKNWVKKIKTKRELKKHPERFMTEEDLEQSEDEPEEKTLDEISEELRNK